MRAKRTTILLLSVIVSSVCSLANAQQQKQTPEERGRWILERLTGAKWSNANPVLQQIQQLVRQGKEAEAAKLATEQSQFYRVTVKQFAAAMSTREETIRAGLTDFAAAFMGVARDQTDARELLYGNFYYMADASQLSFTVPSDLGPDLLASNRHYQALEDSGMDYVPALVRREGQMVVINDANAVAPNPDPSGVLTSRAFLEAHATAGTNRRLVEFTLRQFTCSPIEMWADNLASDVRIGRDIDRAPGGDHAVFQSTCKACHTVMDGFRGAFAKWDFRNSIAVHADGGGSQKASPQTDGNRVMAKMNANGSVYSGGYVTRDDTWVNNALRPANLAFFGWRIPSGGAVENGRGVASFGRLVANSQRFSQCMAQRAFEVVCRKKLPATQLAATVSRLGNAFEKENYNLRRLFELTALDIQCPQ